jgi:SAM-dependent methyltransferase
MDLKNLQKNWDAWGKLDPLWAILSLPDKNNSRWDIDQFFETGRIEINQVLDRTHALGFTFSRGSALDFGCGVGRLSQALCQHFDQVLGVDIAPSMIEQANKYNTYGERCQYFLNTRENLSELSTQKFDFIYSCRVLQHMEPRYCKSYICEFVKLLLPNGVLVFQQPAQRLDTPSEPFGPPESSPLKAAFKRQLPSLLISLYWKIKLAYLAQQDRNRPQMEMYCIDQKEMTNLLASLGASLVHVEEDDAAPDYLSLRYWVTKS